MRIDTHIHLDVMSPAALGNGLWCSPDYRALIPGCDPPDVALALDRFAGDPRIGVAAAIHPWETGEAGDEQDPRWPLLEALAADPRVPAVGECGLDFHKYAADSDRARVERSFVAQIGLAVRHRKPLLLHCVRAHARCLELLKAHHAARVGGLVHAFAGSLEEAHAYARLGFVVSVGAAVTRPASHRVRRTAQTLSPDGFVIETDAPYMASAGRPAWTGAVDDLLDVASTVAELRGVDADSVWAASAATARRVLGSWL